MKEYRVMRGHPLGSYPVATGFRSRAAARRHRDHLAKKIPDTVRLVVEVREVGLWQRAR